MAGSTPRKARNVRVIKSEQNPETPEVLADAIVQISKGFEKLLAQGLTKRAIVVLIQGIPGVNTSKVDIETILDNLPKLASYYVKH